MKIKMALLSDTIFGDGTSIPGAEDISVLCDRQGFPYYKGSTFKGIFGEELERYLELSGKSGDEIRQTKKELLGISDNDSEDSSLIFSDFMISSAIRNRILKETGRDNPELIKEILTNPRTFTKIEDSGIVAEGSLRTARCVDKGIVLYSEIACPDKDAELVKEVLGMIKWIGTMRNRGFGKVKISIVGEVTA